MTIYILKKALKKIQYYVKNCDVEISGFAKISKYGEDSLLIYDAEILEQYVSATHSDFDEESMVRFMTEKIRNKESIVDYKVWWHSHANMQAYFSAIDESTIEQSTEFPFLISLVMNKQYEYACRLDIQNPLRLTIDNIQLVEVDEEDEELEKQCQEEISQMVRKQSLFGGKKKFLIPFSSKKK
ncbi:MAG: hypothetical protein WC346_07865 [Methanogenium sp.]|jgi:proteasome lid subunit RPN8/RPN11